MDSGELKGNKWSMMMTTLATVAENTVLRLNARFTHLENVFGEHLVDLDVAHVKHVAAHRASICGHQMRGPWAGQPTGTGPGASPSTPSGGTSPAVA